MKPTNRRTVTRLASILALSLLMTTTTVPTAISAEDDPEPQPRREKLVLVLSGDVPLQHPINVFRLL